MPTLECVICRRTVSYSCRSEIPYLPFCSQRCQEVDLGRWLSESYRISEELDVPYEQADTPSDDNAPSPE